MARDPCTCPSAIGFFEIGCSPIGLPPSNANHYSKYLQQCQRILNDEDEQMWNIADLKYWVNLGRKRIAMEAECLRILVPSSGSFDTVTVVDGGSGYTTPPTITVSQPDAWGVGYQPAQLEAFTNVSGVVNEVLIRRAGYGYVNPQITITGGGGGSGLVLEFTLTKFIATKQFKETYVFADYACLLPQGAEAIVSLQNVSVSWSGIKPTLRVLDWSGYQAWLRAYNTQSTNWPAVWSQYGRGTGAMVYLNPIPSMTLQMEWDAYCIPKDLESDNDIELLPYPWTDAVQFFVAWQASIQQRDRDSANYFSAEFNKRMKEAGAWSTAVMLPDFYTPAIA